MSNIIILGKGYVSSKIKKYWSDDKYNLIFCSQSDDKYLTHLGELIERYTPTYVVNCYGFTGKPNVDSCENHVDECYTRNVTDAESIMETCEEYGVNFITISTGCVYNDESGRSFSEDDVHNFGRDNPTSSVYSSSKSWFEKYFREFVEQGCVKNKNHLLRIRMPFDGEMDDKNYINKIIKYDKLVNYPNSITYIPDLVKFIQIIVSSDVDSGVYNVVNVNGITAKTVIELYNQIIGDKFDKKVIDKWYTTDDLLSEGLMNCRRSNCVLSTDKIKRYYPDLLSSYASVKKALLEHLTSLNN